MEKTTVRIQPALKKEIDIYASQTGLSLQYLFNEAMRKYLDEQSKAKSIKKKSWVAKLDALDLGREKIALTRENFYKRDEDLA